MLVTEKEARRRWCPQSRSDVRVAYGEPNPSRCIGSQCMAWRWEEALFDGPDSYQAEPGPKGFCGIGGVPIEVLSAQGGQRCQSRQ